MIPKVIHQIWLGDNTMPPVMQVWRQRWQELHPNWRMLLWKEIPDGRGQPMLTTEEFIVVPNDEQAGLLVRACHLSQRSNIWRYLIVRSFGGLYLDTDIEPRKPINELVAGLPAFTARRQRPCDINECAFFGATPEHPWVEQLVLDMGTRDPSVTLSLGVDYFTAITKQHPEVTVFAEKSIKFTIPEEGWCQAKISAKVPSARTDNSLVSSETYAIHHWSSMWFHDGFKPLK